LAPHDRHDGGDRVVYAGLERIEAYKKAWRGKRFTLMAARILAALAVLNLFWPSFS